MKRNKRSGFILSDALIGLVLIGLGVLTYVGLQQVMMQHSQEKQLRVHALRQEYESLAPKLEQRMRDSKQEETTKNKASAKPDEASSHSESAKDSQVSESSNRDTSSELPETENESTLSKLPEQPEEKVSDSK
ncbi:type IV pilus modification PilV family protein [Secundilactobacillus paracollinoides]|uniref:Uncharacterized protein n=1 Tax=Secundilactobacillus paracollinoides TaxID=240427 RepID=A0A1B2J1R6_9LACO|nr:hypothetical protein [Secundilactobacillus paracollinoides]ANZ62274.1 hypothetical protein AYR61_13680 [Secundilactobacillus paracollinoides]ANZ68223.1 hypothetical protein AYR63_14555 [Secundilactobacillus paracollinoides]